MERRKVFLSFHVWKDSEGLAGLSNTAGLSPKVLITPLLSSRLLLCTFNLWEERQCGGFDTDLEGFYGREFWE